MLLISTPDIKKVGEKSCDPKSNSAIQDLLDNNSNVPLPLSYLIFPHENFINSLVRHGIDR